MHRLRRAMRAADLTYVQLADIVGCNPKTVQRWYYEGRVPRRERANRVAAVLKQSVGWLWPVYATPGDVDGFELFPTMSDVPSTLVNGIALALNHLDVCSSDPWFLDTFATPAALTGTPDAPLRMLATPDTPFDATSSFAMLGVDLRMHTEASRISYLRADDTILLAADVFGAPVAQAPAIVITRVSDGGVFDHYSERFNLLWEQAYPPHGDSLPLLAAAAA